MAELVHDLQVPGATHHYRAVVGERVLEGAAGHLAAAGLEGRPRIVADEVAWRHHGARLLDGLGLREDAAAVQRVPRALGARDRAAREPRRAAGAGGAGAPGEEENQERRAEIRAAITPRSAHALSTRGHGPARARSRLRR